LTGLGLAIATKGEWDPEKLLRILRKAGVGPAVEVHLACDPEHAPATSAPGLSIHLRENASLFELWGLAIDRCKTPWIAILHADALPAPGWFAAMNEAIEREGKADGYWGPVEPDFGPDDPRTVGYFTEYVQFRWPVPIDMKEVPGSNLVLSRQRLGFPGDDFSKTRLLGEGLKPKLVEQARVRYARPYRFVDYCGRRFRHGRAYAAKRTPKLSLIKAIPMTLILPAVRTDRILAHAFQHRQGGLSWLRWFPSILLAETCWSMGELVGYVTERPGDPARLD
jgi:hypothetical protein